MAEAKACACAARRAHATGHDLPEVTMAQHERRAWFIVASLFLVLLLIAGSGANTFGVFLPTLLKAFPHWSRARVAPLPSALFFFMGRYRHPGRMVARSGR